MNFEDEIVISNARERHLNPDTYGESLQEFLEHIPRVLTPRGYFVLIFNARQASRWSALRTLGSTSFGGRATTLSYLGCFPCIYSAGSVVQDNRKGSLASDYAMVFGRSHHGHNDTLSELNGIPNWSRDFPVKFNQSD